MKNDHFIVFLAVWVVLPKLLDRLRVTYVRTEQNNKSGTCSCYPIVFISFNYQDLFCDRYWQGGVLKFMKNYHIFSFNCQIIILAVWVLSPKFLGRLRSSLG